MRDQLQFFFGPLLFRTTTFIFFFLFCIYFSNMRLYIHTSTYTRTRLAEKSTQADKRKKQSLSKQGFACSQKDTASKTVLIRARVCTAVNSLCNAV